MDRFGVAFVTVSLASLLVALPVGSKSTSLVLMSAVAAGAGAALAHHTVAPALRTYTPSKGTYVGALVPADRRDKAPPHPIMRVRIGSATVPALLDTGFGTVMTVTHTVLRMVRGGIDSSMDAAALMEQVEQADNDASGRPNNGELLDTARTVLNLSVGVAHEVHMVGLASSMNTESISATGVLQLESVHQGFSSPDTCGSIPMLITDLPSMPCIITMPYLMARAPLTLSFSSDVSLAFGETLGSLAEVCVPRQWHAGGVCSVEVVIECGDARVCTCLIVDTGFPGTITLNESVAKRLQAPCSNVVENAGVAQYDVFYNGTCSGVLEATATIVAVAGPPITFSDFNMLITTGDMDFGDGLIGMGLLQSLIIGLERGQRPLHLKDTKVRTAVTDTSQWAEGSTCENPVTHCRADGVGSK